MQHLASTEITVGAVSVHLSRPRHYGEAAIAKGLALKTNHLKSSCLISLATSS